MCKIIVFTNLSKVKNIKKLTKVSCDKLSDTDRDGFGYTVQTASGYYGEKTIDPLNFRPSFKKPVLDAPFVDHTYARFGVQAKPVGAGMFHGRISTNSVNIINTHPINKRGWSLIHNGVVTDHGPKYEMDTTNDTEHVLERLSTEGMPAIERWLSGYYAVAAIDPSGILHLFRDSRAYLFVTYIKEIESFMFATTVDLIEEVSKEMGWKSLSLIEPMLDDTYVTFKNGEMLSCQKIKPLGYTVTESQHASKSLGREIAAPSRATYPYAPDWVDYVEKEDDYIAKMIAINEEPGLSESEKLFLSEIEECFDHSYEVYDYNNRPIDNTEFINLSVEEKLECTVVRADGTIVCPIDYTTERLFEYTNSIGRKGA